MACTRVWYPHYRPCSLCSRYPTPKVGMRQGEPVVRAGQVTGPKPRLRQSDHLNITSQSYLVSAYNLTSFTRPGMMAHASQVPDRVHVGGWSSISSARDRPKQLVRVYSSPLHSAVRFSSCNPRYVFDTSWFTAHAMAQDTKRLSSIMTIGSKGHIYAFSDMGSN
jgi:hypothetical protein